MLPRLHDHADVFLLGAGTEAHAFFGRSGVHIILDFARADLPGLLHTLAADAAVLMPTVAETFGYLLSELRDLGVPVIATRMGAYVERVDDGVDGFLVDATADAIVARVIELAARRESLATVRDNLAVRREPDLASMAQAYAGQLRLPTLSAMRYPLTRHGVQSQQLAVQASELDAAAKREAQVTRELRASTRESRRRGEWGHALDGELAVAREQLVNLGGELDSRTEWALRLDAELGESRQISNSRIWRYTRPLRSAVTRLRDLRASWPFEATACSVNGVACAAASPSNGCARHLARLVREFARNGSKAGTRDLPVPTEAFSPFAVPSSEQRGSASSSRCITSSPIRRPACAH